MKWRLIKAAFFGIILLALAFVSTCLRLESCIYPQAQTYPGIYAVAYEYIDSVLLPLCCWLREWDANRTIAVGTAVIAIFTFSLWLSTNRLWTVTRDSLKLARDEFNANHRPRILVRGMGVALVMNKPSHIEFTLVNTGEAVVTGCNWKTTVLLLDSIGAVHGVPTFGSEGADSYNKPLHVGEGIVRNLLNPIELDPADHIVISNKQEFLHVLGYIAYSDAVGVTRRTGFFRYYDPDRRRFRKVDDPEYEYQD